MKRIYNYYPENNYIDLRTVKAEPLCSPRTGEPVKNQYSIHLGHGLRMYQSYNTQCLMFDLDCWVITVYPAAFTASKTTSKYAKQFLIDFCGLTAAKADEVKKLQRPKNSRKKNRCILSFEEEKS